MGEATDEWKPETRHPVPPAGFVSETCRWAVRRSLVGHSAAGEAEAVYEAY
jgi:hypothetical protein